MINYIFPKGGNPIVRYLLSAANLSLIAGSFFKIQHYPYADEVSMYALIAILLLYPIRFFGKQLKLLKDYLKLVWVEFGAASVLLLMLDVKPKWLFSGCGAISTVAFLATFILTMTEKTPTE